MPLPRFKQKCKICRQEWVILNRKEFPICPKCHLRQIFSEEITDKKYSFLNQPREIYEQSRFLRNIRQAYLTYKELTPKQIQAFKETLKKLSSPSTKKEPKQPSSSPDHK